MPRQPRPSVVSNRKPPRKTNSDHPTVRRKFKQSKRSARNARRHPTVDLDAIADDIEAESAAAAVAAEPEPIAEPYFADPASELSVPVRTIPRRACPSATPNQIRAAQNLIDAIGTPQAIEALRASGKPKPARLADMMESSDYDAWTFYAKLDSVGLNLVEFTELLLDVKQAKMVARLVTGGEEIAEQVLARATDRFEPHTACRASGHVLVEDEKTGALIVTPDECFSCEGSGYILKTAEREDVELYLELIKLRKNTVMVDARKQFNTLNANLYGAGAGGDLGSLDGAPDVNSIIKRADEQMLIAPTSGKQVTDGSERVPDLVMPEDSVVEAEVVEPVNS